MYWSCAMVFSAMCGQGSRFNKQILVEAVIIPLTLSGKIKYPAILKPLNSGGFLGSQIVTRAPESFKHIASLHQ